MMRIFPLILSLFLLLSCGQDKRLQWALELADRNRPALEQVLDYYKNDLEKRKAAEFLISNMPFHHGVSVLEIDTIKTLRRNMFLYGDFSKEKMQEWKKKKWTPVCHPSDVQLADKDLIIDNIEYAFKAWKSRPWSVHYSFDDFCEYVLPYRLYNEPLESWREFYYEKYSTILDSLYQGTDVVEAGRLLATYLKNEGYFFGYNFSVSHIGPSFLFRYRTGYCADFCDVVAYVFRAVGIPVSIDYYLQSPSNNSTHSWNAIIDTTGRAVPFNYTDNVPVGRDIPMNRKSGKVYRTCYGIQEEKYKGLYEDSLVPEIFRQPLTRDVSGEYYREKTSCVQMASVPKMLKWIYLSIYTGKEYKEVDVSPVKNKKADFYNLEKDVLYHPTYIDGGESVAFGNPFMIDSLENTHRFEPKKDSVYEVRLTRKYPMRKEAGHLVKIVDIRIEGSNDPSFKNAELLYCVKDTPAINYNMYQSVSQKSFRYVRLKGSNKRKMGVAEWHLYEYGKKEHPIIPIAVSHGSVDEPNWEHAKDLFMDGDWVTWFAATYKGSELVQDLGHPYRIENILLIPQNDDNFVRIGDEYELFYQDGIEGWVSLGRKTATETSICYSVPAGAVFWLKNHTRGKEERCFYIENGEQIFP